MTEAVYLSKVRVERILGPKRRAYLPAREDPIYFGVHSEIAEHYGTDLSIHQPNPATLDYVVAAAAG